MQKCLFTPSAVAPETTVKPVGDHVAEVYRQMHDAPECQEDGVAEGRVDASARQHSWQPPEEARNEVTYEGVRESLEREFEGDVTSYDKSRMFVVRGASRHKCSIYLTKEGVLKGSVGCAFSTVLLSGVHEAIAYVKANTVAHDDEHINRAGLRRLLEQQSFRCALTGEPLTPETATLDHIIPVRSGGSHSMSNVQFVTAKVNAAKGSMLLDEFIAMCRDVAARHPPG